MQKCISLRNLLTPALLVLLFGCGDEKDKTPASLDTLFMNISKVLESGTVKPGFTYTSKSGNILVSTPSFTDNLGQDVNGDLTVSFQEVITKGDMIRSQTPTQTTDGKILESIGQLYFAVAKDGKPVNIRPSENLFIEMANTSGFGPGMDVYYGKLDIASGLVVWEGDGTPDTYDVEVVQQNGDTRFNFFSKNLYWINNAIELPDPVGPAANICATLAEGFNADNSVVYMAFDNRSSVIKLDDPYCVDNLTDGEDVTIIVLGVKGTKGKEEYYLAKQSVSASNGSTVELTPAKSTIAEIQAVLDVL